MTEHKFTDEQIIRCLNECNGKDNVVAHIVSQGEDKLVTLGRIVEIINRQKEEIAEYQKHIDNDIIYVRSVKTEAIKEFAERLKAELTTGLSVMRRSTLDVIDELVKEMTEEEP